MSGVAGRIGVKHSLLRVSVGDGSSGHAYVIEKAAPPTDVEQFKNGAAPPTGMKNTRSALPADNFFIANGYGDAGLDQVGGKASCACRDVHYTHDRICNGSSRNGLRIVCVGRGMKYGHKMAPGAYAERAPGGTGRANRSIANPPNWRKRC